MEEIRAKGLPDGKLVVQQNALKAVQIKALQELADTVETIRTKQSTLNLHAERIETTNEKVDVIHDMLVASQTKQAFENPPWPREIKKKEIFIGNETLLQDLHDRMWHAPSNSASKIVCQANAVRGLGGVGKSAFVKQILRILSRCHRKIICHRCPRPAATTVGIRAS